MANHTKTFAADASLTQIAIAKKPRSEEKYLADIQIAGGFGGGTVTLFVSLDGGTNKVALRNLSGTAYSTTVADVVPVSLVGGGDNDEPVIIYATVANATTPTLTIIVGDNT